MTRSPHGRQPAFVRSVKSIFLALTFPIPLLLLAEILEANFQDDLAIHALRCTEQRAKG
jgi:hypothetical protein